MKTVAIVQARMASSRLPGKVLRELAGAPVLEHVVERVSRSSEIDGVIVATSIHGSDDRIVAWCNSQAVPVYRGSPSDVLDRYLGAARASRADVVVRITADCPATDHRLVTRLVQRQRDEGWDFVTNMIPPTWPYGLAVEVFPLAVLSHAGSSASRADEREHVTPYIYRHPERFSIFNVESPTDLSGHRWTIDTEEDLDLVRRLFSVAKVRHPDFGFEELLEVAEDNPEWSVINSHVPQVVVSVDGATDA